MALKAIKNSNMIFWIFVFLLIHQNTMFANKTYPIIKLVDVLNSVDRHFPQIKIALLEVVKANGSLINAKGKFDPLLDAKGNSWPVGGYISNYGDTQVTLPTLYNGVKLFAGYRNGEGDWPIYDQNYLTNSGGEYRAGISLPLLRDRLIDKDRTDLLTTAQAVLMKEQDAEAIKIKIYHEAIRAYWQWVEAGLQLKTFEQLLALANTRQDAVEKQAHQGAMPMLAITENMQHIMQRKQFLNQGKMIFEQASINLSLYFRDRDGQQINPDKKNLPDLLQAATYGRAKKVAIINHPAIKKLNNFTKIMKLKRDLARNELLPQLDATAATYKQYGSGGYPLLIPQALMIGVTFKFPVYQRQAKGNLIQAQSELRQVKVEKKFIYEQLNNEYSKILIGINRSNKQLRFLLNELNFAKKVQHGETQKFYAGDSNLFLVNQREQATTQVQLNTIHAEAQLEELKSRANFFATTKRKQ
jgi:outer membrane protein TolC